MIWQMVYKFVQTMAVVLVAGVPAFWVLFRQPAVEPTAGPQWVGSATSGGRDCADVSSPARDSIDVRSLSRARAWSLWGFGLLVLSAGAQLAFVLGPIVDGLPLLDQLIVVAEFLWDSTVGRYILYRLLTGAAVAFIFSFGVWRGWLGRHQNRFPPSSDAASDGFASEARGTVPGFARRSSPGGRRSPAAAIWRIAVVAGVLLLTLSVAFSGHAIRGLAQSVAIGSQWLHLSAVSVWAGGVFSFARLPWRQLALAPDKYVIGMRRGMATLSRVGGGAVLAFIVTGVVLSGLYVYGVEVAVGSLYGRMLIAKLTVVGLVLAIAAINRYWLLPQVSDGGVATEGHPGSAIDLEANPHSDPDAASGAHPGLLGTAASRLPAAGVDRAPAIGPHRAPATSPDRAAAIGRVFWRVAVVLRIEAAVMVIVLALSAALTQAPPVSTPGQTEGRHWSTTAGPWDVDIAMASAGPAEIVFTIDVADRESGRPTDVDAIELQLDMPGHFMGIPPLTPEAVSAGRYEARSKVAMAGPWEAAFILEDGGRVEYIFANFQIAAGSKEHYSPLQRLFAYSPGGLAIFVLSLVVGLVGAGLLASAAGPAPGSDAGFRPGIGPGFDSGIGPGFGAGTDPASGAGFRPDSDFGPSPERGGRGVQIALGALLVVTGFIWTAQLGGLSLPGWPGTAAPAEGTAGASDTGARLAGSEPVGSGVRTFDLDDPGAAGPGATRFVQARDAGEYLVEARVGPMSPGANSVELHIQNYEGVPVEGASVSLQIAVGDGDGAARFEAAADETGAGVYRAQFEATAAGAWRMTVVLDDGSGAPGETTFEASIPIKGAEALLELADKAMNALGSVRLREELRGMPGGPIVTDQTFVAPDRMHMAANTGVEMRIIGDTRYQRVLPDGTWRAGRWPRPGGYVWPDFDYAGLSVQSTLLGIESIDGRDMFVVSFVQERPRTLYTLWIDVADYRIHYVEMMTTGHYMYWTLYDFDEPLEIDAPAGLD